MADVTAAEPAGGACCSSERQASCCDPSEKRSCCGSSAPVRSCGCSAGAEAVAAPEVLAPGQFVLDRPREDQ